MEGDLRDPAVITPLLRRWAAGEVHDVVRLPGHSGITFSFAVRGTRGPSERLVVKVPPLGVAQRDNADVLRQVPVLQLMAREGVAVPRVRASGVADEGPFGVPFLVMEHVRGAMPGDIFDGPLVGDPATLLDRGLAELAAIHAVDGGSALGARSRAGSVADEVEHWVPVLEKGHDEEWTRRGLEVRDRLRATLPRSAQTGVVHGDYYSNNWLFDHGVLTAVLDWENAALGPQLLDLGWLCMMYDPASWGPTRRAWMGAEPEPEWLVARYEAHAGLTAADIDWYRALAGYRLACLTAHYLRLHRTGRRVDPVWEVFGEAFPFLLSRAEWLLAGLE